MPTKPKILLAKALKGHRICTINRMASTAINDKFDEW